MALSFSQPIIAIIKLVNTGNKKNISTASETPRISIAFNIAYEKTAVIIPSPIAVKASAIGSFKPAILAITLE